MTGQRAYATLLQLYPGDYRERFAAEMLATFGEGSAQFSERGPAAAVRFALVEFMALLAGAALEWWAKLTCDRSTRGRCLPDPRMMRPPGVTQAEWFGAAGHEPGR